MIKKIINKYFKNKNPDYLVIRLKKENDKVPDVTVNGEKILFKEEVIFDWKTAPKEPFGTYFEVKYYDQVTRGQKKIYYKNFFRLDK